MTSDSDPSEPGPRDATAAALLQALQQPGCSICLFVEQGVHAYLDAISYEAVNDPGVRAELRASLGYCAVHGAQWFGLHNALGLAVIYQDVCARVGQVFQAKAGTVAPAEESPAGLLDKLQHLVGNDPGGAEAGRALAQSLEPEGPCPACRHLLHVEAQAVGACAGALGDPAFRDAYAQHALGLCLPHFRAVVRRVNDPSVLQAVAQIQATHFTQTCNELGEVIRKFDYRYQDEPRGPEFQAPGRSVEQAAGRLPAQLNLPHVALRPESASE